ncbi:lysozyme inhibitor LprI family protein [uncultured Thiodictyon sp.]|uniref:lysozyme inhibitor LprI family protein n=1 Tax=uncultured Thiodictyon sp. TaxID=1846217 RepID=UPI0025DD512C|nr:lysozyme inhibitor LprI family protein [uncultured Thiodictyon sp.]
MRFTQIAAVSALSALLALPAWAADPSFRCSKVAHEVEDLICKDGELADLDRQLSGLYGVVLRHTPPSQQRQLKSEQRGWLKGRNDCWKDSDQRGCVKAAYEDRIRELQDR